MGQDELVKKHPDVNPFLLEKWERVFNAFFDRDDSKVIDWGDFYKVTRHVREIYGAESNQMSYAKQSLSALWQGMLALCDRNKDDKIQVDEWVQVLKKTDPKTEPKWFVDYMTFIFKLFDVSEDDRLDLAEYTDGMNAYGFSTDQAHRAFHMIASDSKGHEEKAIPFAQFKRLWDEYFFSTKKSDHGNYLFGDFLSEQEEKK